MTKDWLISFLVAFIILSGFLLYMNIYVREEYDKCMRLTKAVKEVIEDEIYIPIEDQEIKLL